MEVCVVLECDLDVRAIDGHLERRRAHNDPRIAPLDVSVKTHSIVVILSAIMLSLSSGCSKQEPAPSSAGEAQKHRSLDLHMLACSPHCKMLVPASPILS